MCDQLRLRPACAYVQSDQSLCKSLEFSMTFRLLTEHNLEFLSFKGGCTGSSESTFVSMPHCWKSHVPGSKAVVVVISDVCLSFYFVKLSPDMHTVPDVFLLNYYERKQCRFRLAGFTAIAIYFHSNNRTRNNVYETLCPKPFVYQEGWYSFITQGSSKV